MFFDQKSHFWRSARSKISFFGGPRAQNTFSLDYTDFLDSIDSTESTDIIDSIDSILEPHKETANIHTTHKGARALRAREQKYRWGRRLRRRPHRYFCFPFVCGVAQA